MNISVLNSTRTKKEVTPEMVNEVNQCFSLFDRDGKGHLTKQETKYAVMALLGTKPIKVFIVSSFLSLQSELNMLFRESQEEPMHLQRFSQLMLQKLVMRNSDDDIRQVFISLDISCILFYAVFQTIRFLHEQVLDLLHCKIFSVL